MRRALLLVASLACTQPQLGEFKMPRNIEDVRGRLLPFVEGHRIEEAREFLRGHGFDCEGLPSATDAHAHVCRAVAAPADAGWRHWTIVMFERGGRVADVQVRR